MRERGREKAAEGGISRLYGVVWHTEDLLNIFFNLPFYEETRNIAKSVNFVVAQIQCSDEI